MLRDIGLLLRVVLNLYGPGCRRLPLLPLFLLSPLLLQALLAEEKLTHVRTRSRRHLFERGWSVKRKKIDTQAT